MRLTTITVQTTATIFTELTALPCRGIGRFIFDEDVVGKGVISCDCMCTKARRSLDATHTDLIYMFDATLFF